MKIYRIYFGKKLKAAREAVGLTQSELAEKVGVEPPTVSRWESGTDFAGDERIPKIIKALKVSSDYFEIANNEVKQLGLREAADFLSTFANLPLPYQKVILALAYKNPMLVRDIDPELGKPFQALLSAL